VCDDLAHLTGRIKGVLIRERIKLEDVLGLGLVLFNVQR